MIFLKSDVEYSLFLCWGQGGDMRHSLCPRGPRSLTQKAALHSWGKPPQHAKSRLEMPVHSLCFVSVGGTTWYGKNRPAIVKVYVTLANTLRHPSEAISSGRVPHQEPVGSWTLQQSPQRAEGVGVSYCPSVGSSSSSVWKSKRLIRSVVSYTFCSESRHCFECVWNVPWKVCGMLGRCGSGTPNFGLLSPPLILSNFPNLFIYFFGVGSLLFICLSCLLFKGCGHNSSAGRGFALHSRGPGFNSHKTNCPGAFGTFTHISPWPYPN